MIGSNVANPGDIGRPWDRAGGIGRPSVPTTALPGFTALAVQRVLSTRLRLTAAIGLPPAIGEELVFLKTRLQLTLRRQYW